MVKINLKEIDNVFIINNKNDETDSLSSITNNSGLELE